jgi:structural maintenance of chromosome 3 (chondroitin sulfate proteoglycan 6)
MVFIKSIVMNSFMSYKDQKELKHKFSEKTNAIVGLNGSGKSNFFNAIRFVCDMFENIHADQRYRSFLQKEMFLFEDSPF